MKHIKFLKVFFAFVEDLANESKRNVHKLTTVYLLQIKPFRQAHLNRDTDKELLKLSKYLKDIADLDDFTQLNHKKWERFVEFENSIFLHKKRWVSLTTSKEIKTLLIVRGACYTRTFVMDVNEFNAKKSALCCKWNLILLCNIPFILYESEKF